MSKMRMPEMSVVRFNESDVIVASGDKFASNIMLIDFGNGTPNDAKVQIDGTTYSRTSGPNTISRAQSIYSNFDNYTAFYWNRGEGEVGDNNFYQILGDDNNYASVPGLDGNYEWQDAGLYGAGFYSCQ